ncbi:MAG TPA: YtxH domain-containing protein [Polyangiaceae bacterium]
MNRYMEGVRDALSRAGLVQSSTSTWLSGFAVGAGFGLIAGAAVAILVTPTNGREMRQELGWRAKKLAERTQGAIADVTQTVKEKVANAERELPYQGRNEVPVG